MELHWPTRKRATKYTPTHVAMIVSASDVGGWVFPLLLQLMLLYFVFVNVSLVCQMNGNEFSRTAQGFPL